VTRRPINRKTTIFSSYQSSGMAGLTAEASHTAMNSIISVCRNRLDRKGTRDAVELVVKHIA
jgi:hypothetical protein